MTTILGTRIAAIRLLVERQHRLEKEASFRARLTEAELRALRSQVDPHFLFNALNAIAELTAIRPEAAEAMTLRLAETFRYVVTHGDDQVVALRQEIQFAEAYVAVQKERFGELLSFEVDVSATLLDCAVPVLLLQPLLENAIKYCIARSSNGGRIILSGRGGQDGFELRLRNSRDVMPDLGTGDGQSTKVGLRNVRARLKLAFGPEAELDLVEQDPRNAEVIAFIPYLLKPT